MILGMKYFIKKRKKKMKVNKKDYEVIYDCIVSEQVSPDRIAKYFEDKKFLNYWRKRNEYKKDE